MSLLSSISATVVSGKILTSPKELIIANTVINNLGMTCNKTVIDSNGISCASTISADSFVSAGDTIVHGNLYVGGSIVTCTMPLQPVAARQTDSFNVRIQAAQNEYNLVPPPHVNNGDEILYPSYIAQFSKGLQHDALGNPVISSYNSLLNAVNTGLPEAYDSIVLGGAAGKMVDPQAGVCFTLQGADTAALAVPSAAPFASDDLAGQEVEAYWAALTRDVPFVDYDSNSLIADACADLSNQAVFTGPKVNGNVTPSTLCRINYPGALVGPYISQFLYVPFYMGAQLVDQKIKVPVSGESNNFCKTLPIVLGLQSGGSVTEAVTWDSVARFIRNGRDLAEWVHNDMVYQAGMNALQVLTKLGCPVNSGNPYKSNTTQAGFATFGGPHIQTLLSEVCSQGLRAVWFQKWNVNRTLRPEEYALRVQQKITGAATYPLSTQVLNSAALTKTFVTQGSYLLSQAYPEGAPRHPSYPSGHATVAGAMVTVLKAWFTGSFVIANPVVPDATGVNTVPYLGATLTVEGELNKLAVNIAQGRVMAGVHYRSDSTSGIELGEKVAISILRDQKLLFNEPFAGFTFTKFDGTVITV